MSSPPPDREQPPRMPQQAPGLPSPPPVRRARSHDLAWEENKSRLIGIANSHLRQGKHAEAKVSLDELIALAPDDAAVHELAGDVAASIGAWPTAVAAYKAALQKEPGRPSAEVKLAKAALGQFERARLLNMDSSALRGGDATGGGDVSAALAARHRKFAILISLIIPGLGHLLLGQTVKAAVIFGLYALGTVILVSLPGSQALLEQSAHLFAPGKSSASASGASGGLSLFICLALTAILIYAVVDCRAAAQSESKLEDIL